MANEPNFEQLIPVFWIVEKDVQLVESCGYGHMTHIWVTTKTKNFVLCTFSSFFCEKWGTKNEKSIFLENTGKILTSTDLKILAHPFCVLSKYRSSLAFRFSFIFLVGFSSSFQVIQSREKLALTYLFQKKFFMSDYDCV